MAIDKEEVRRIARLAHLEHPKSESDHLLDDATLTKLAEDLNGILEHVRELASIDTKDVPPTSHPVPLRSRMREDESTEPRTADDLLAAAPARQGDAVRVPRIVE